MRQVLEAKFWIDRDEQGVISLGLTQEFLDSVGIIWVASPKNVEKIELGKTFLVIESSKMLMSLRSPLAGEVVEWNEEFLEHPNVLGANDFLVKVKLCDAEPVIQS